MTMTISVLMPAHNASRFLPEAIESVLVQTHRDFEFLIIDDGSTDDTLRIARSFAMRDNRIRIIDHENIGMGASLNHAMREAKGKWIARIDADDRMVPNRLERQLIFLQDHPNLAVASSLVHYIDETGSIIGQNASRFTTREGVAEAVVNHWPIGFHHPAAIFRKDIIEKIGGYRPQFWPADDMDLWNRVVEAEYEVLVQPEYLTKYRIHGSSVTVGKFRETEQKSRWVEACMAARRNGIEEPTWEQFLRERDHQSWPKWLNSRRRDYARALYKAAVYHFSKREYVKLVPGLLAAVALEPWYVLQRILPQLKKT
jgi:glycosyltransferase involved in cell wall biosynthesis